MYLISVCCPFFYFYLFAERRREKWRHFANLAEYPTTGKFSNGGGGEVELLLLPLVVTVRGSTRCVGEWWEMEGQQTSDEPIKEPQRKNKRTSREYVSESILV